MENALMETRYSNPSPLVKRSRGLRLRLKNEDELVKLAERLRLVNDASHAALPCASHCQDLKIHYLHLLLGLIEFN